MTTAETLYVVTFSVYLLFFLLFARFFVWRYYSERKYWNRRPSITESELVSLAHRLGKQVPFISVLVPARNEAVVIENTIRHLVSLRYPKQSLEILVVTDEKETQATEDERQNIIKEVLDLIHKQRNGCELSQKAREGIIAVLSDLALAEFVSRKFEDGYSLGIPDLCLLPARERQLIVRDI